MAARSLRVVGLLVFLLACSTEPSAGITPEPPVEATPDPTGQADFLVDFGPRAVGERAVASLALRNTGTARLELQAESVDAPFQLAAGALGLGAGETGELSWAFAPSAARASSEVTRVDSTAGSFTVRLAGEGFAGDLSCDTSFLDFGPGVSGQERHLQLVCANATTHPWTPVIGALGGEDASQYRASLAPLPSGNGWKVDVALTYRGVGTLSATLPLLSPDGRTLWTASLVAYGLSYGVSCSPTAIDFGFVAPHGEKHARIVCTNGGAEPVLLTSLSLDPSSHLTFSWTPSEYPIAVPGAVGDVPGTVAIDVTFSPTLDALGSRRNGILVITTDDGSRIDVTLTGFCGGPVIACSPAQVDFGVVAAGLPVTRSIVCSNVGTDDPTRNDDRLMVTGLDTTRPDAFTAVFRAGPKPEGYAIGETFTLDVTYHPTTDGLDDGLVRIASNAVNTTAEQPYGIRLQGQGRVLPACDFEVAPAELRFGNVPKDHAATLEFAIRNHRADAECLVRDLRFGPDCSRAFSLPAGAIAVQTLAPGGELHVPVQFLPTTYTNQPYTCDVLFDISTPANPHQVVPVRGASVESCLSLEPAELDFGTARSGCATRERTIEIWNHCTTPAVPGTLDVHAPSGVFAIRSSPPVGYVIEPGAHAAFTVAYRPRFEDEGVELGSVLVGFDGLPEPLLATLRGRAALDPTEVDRFEQPDRPKVDVLWVIDNSGGMWAEQQALANNLNAFLSFARSQGVDYQLGVTTTSQTPGGGCPGGADGGEAGRLFPIDHSRPRILTPTTPNLEAAWQGNVMVGTCRPSGPIVFDVAYRGLLPPIIDHADDPGHPEPNDGNLGFLRPDAHLSIIAVTDGVEVTHPSTAGYYYDSFVAMKGGRPELFNFHAITGDRGSGCNTSFGSAPADESLVSMTEHGEGGLFRSICSTDWTTMLREIGAAAFGYQTCFYPLNQPEDTNGNGNISDTEGELAVQVNGVVTPSRGAQGQSVWTYRADRNAVCFHPLAAPEPGAQIDLAYRTACLSW